MSPPTIAIVIFTIIASNIGQLTAIQEYAACEDSFQCTTYCKLKGFNDRVCKTITVDESFSIDGSQLVNRRVCLCSDTKEEYGVNAASGEYSSYWLSPGHECTRNGSDRTCKEYCKRIRIAPEHCMCALSACKFPKRLLSIPQTAFSPWFPWFSYQTICSHIKSNLFLLFVIWEDI